MQTFFEDLNNDCIREIVAKLDPYNRVTLASTSKELWQGLHECVNPTSFEGLHVQDFHNKINDLENAYIDVMDAINDIVQPIMLRWHRRGILLIECGHSQIRLPSMGNVGDVSSITYSSSGSVYPFKIRYQLRHDIEIVYNATSQEFEDNVDLYSHVYSSVLQIGIADIKKEMKAQVSEFSTIWNAVVEFSHWMHNEMLLLCSFLTARYAGHVYSVAWNFLSWKGCAEGPFLLHVNSFHSFRYLLGVHQPTEAPLTFGRDTPDVVWSVYSRDIENEIVIHGDVSNEDQERILGMIVRFKELRGKVYKVYDAEKKAIAAERGVPCAADKVMPPDNKARAFVDVVDDDMMWWKCAVGNVVVA